MPKFSAKFLKKLKDGKSDKFKYIEGRLKEQNTNPQYAMTIGEFCKSEFEPNIRQYKTANETNKEITLNTMLYYYFFLNEKSQENEFKEEKDFIKKFFNDNEITDKQLESISKYANKEKTITADLEDIGKDGEEISESARKREESERRKKQQEERKRELEEAKKQRLIEEEERARKRQEEKEKPVDPVEQARNTMVSVGEGKPVHLFEGFLYERTNHQEAGTDQDFIKAANEASESVKNKSTDDLMKEFNENFGLGEKPTQKETEIRNKVVDQIKTKEYISLLDIQVYNSWARKTYGKPKSIDNVAKGIAQYNALNQKYQKRLFSRWFEWTGFFPEATKEKNALNKMRNHMEKTLNVPVSRIDKQLNDGKNLAIAMSDLSKSERFPIFKNDNMEKLYPPKQFNLESNSLDIPNNLFEDKVETKETNKNLNNEKQLQETKEVEQVMEQ